MHRNSCSLGAVAVLGGCGAKLPVFALLAFLLAVTVFQVGRFIGF
ncbi:MAG: hypothetical protein WBY47_18135 [Desulfobacterales bacterium]